MHRNPDQILALFPAQTTPREIHLIFDWSPVSAVFGEQELHLEHSWLNTHPWPGQGHCSKTLPNFSPSLIPSSSCKFLFIPMKKFKYFSLRCYQKKKKKKTKMENSCTWQSWKHPTNPKINSDCVTIPWAGEKIDFPPFFPTLEKADKLSGCLECGRKAGKGQDCAKGKAEHKFQPLSVGKRGKVKESSSRKEK